MAIDQYRERYARWRLDDVLKKYVGMRVTPSRGDALELAGKLAFTVQGPGGVVISDEYAVALAIPVTFPNDVPVAWERGNRIPPDFHTLDNGAMCLSAPTEQRLILATSPTLITFIERLVIPYLFGFSHFTKYGTMPFDELAHGNLGLRQHFALLFGLPNTSGVDAMVWLAALRRRIANKKPCPCRSGKRVGRCHHRRINALRRVLTRGWFRSCYVELTGKVSPIPRPKTLGNRS